MRDCGKIEEKLLVLAEIRWVNAFPTAQAHSLATSQTRPLYYHRHKLLLENRKLMTDLQSVLY